jgi:leader peptidase (prepilin peptidase)/N-methyltransferase
MDLAFTIMSVLCLISAAGLLAALFIIDLRHFLLLDKFVFPFAVLGAFFHTSTHFLLLSPTAMALGAFTGGGLLWIIRWGGTKYYKQEAMGLGDVKLLLAAGIWLGPEHTITAILLGATAGLIHGLGVAAARALKTGTFSIDRLIIPAGPGFIVGIIAAFIWAFGGPYITHLETVMS